MTLREDAKDTGKQHRREKREPDRVRPSLHGPRLGERALGAVGADSSLDPY
jgi:hypothetical protein